MVIRHSYRRQETTFRAFKWFFISDKCWIFLVKQNTMRDCTQSVTEYRLSVTMYTKYTLQTTDSSRYFIYNLIKAGLMFLFNVTRTFPYKNFLIWLMLIAEMKHIHSFYIEWNTNFEIYQYHRFLYETLLLVAELPQQWCQMTRESLSNDKYLTSFLWHRYGKPTKYYTITHI